VWDPKRVRIAGVAWSDCGFTWEDAADGGLTQERACAWGAMESMC
jgi:hypothetical protein